ncbi:MAG: hypothetical protein GF390_02075 [Candidatus Pacebacteria bacterium]|nr:hypothetical protein [Candidatus Paceibacterota bacterium]
MTRSQKYFWIFLILLILKQILPLLLTHQSFNEVGVLLVLKDLRQILPLEDYLQFIYVPKMVIKALLTSMLQTLSSITIFSRVTWQSDNEFFKVKILIDQLIKHFYLITFSLKSWWQCSQQLLQNLQQQLSSALQACLPSESAALIMGMVFGNTAYLSADLKKSLQITGMTHVVSASGYNVSLIMAVGLLLLKPVKDRLPATLTAMILVILIWSYLYLAGAGTALLRAAIMASFSVLASKVCHRQYHPGYSLALTTSLLLLIEPSFWQSISFQLSITATLGLILILPNLTNQPSQLASWSLAQLHLLPVKRSTKDNLLSTILAVFKESLLVSLAAQTFTLPLLLFHFGELSLLSLLTNTLLLWLVPLITVGGIVVLGVSWLLTWLPWSWQQPSYLLLSLPMNFLTQAWTNSIHWFGQWEQGLIKLPRLSWPAVLMSWLVLVGWLKARARLSKAAQLAWQRHQQLQFSKQLKHESQS